MLQLSLDFVGRTWRKIAAPQKSSPRSDHLIEWKNGISVRIHFHPRARRYLLRLQPDGVARLVIPRRGTKAGGLHFLDQSASWLLRKRADWERHNALRPAHWQAGSRLSFRGEDVCLRVVGGEESQLCFGDQVIPLAQEAKNYRPMVEAHLRRLATRELPQRTHELASKFGVMIHHVTVRAQKTRWGSCSARGTISLNWRLIQASPEVADYLIIHELMHRREMNHSARFWRHVATACPGYREAEAWLKKFRLG